MPTNLHSHRATSVLFVVLVSVLAAACSSSSSSSDPLTEERLTKFANELSWPRGAPPSVLELRRFGKAEQTTDSAGLLVQRANACSWYVEWINLADNHEPIPATLLDTLARDLPKLSFLSDISGGREAFETMARQAKANDRPPIARYLQLNRCESLGVEWNSE